MLHSCKNLMSRLIHRLCGGRLTDYVDRRQSVEAEGAENSLQMTVLVDDVACNEAEDAYS